VAVLAGLAEIAKHYAVDHYDPEIVVVDGDQAAVLINASFVQRSSQRILRVRLASFQRYRDGRLILFREFFDSYDAVEQAIGRELEL
jgi:ketosteroid isomerase-like protein